MKTISPAVPPAGFLTCAATLSAAETPAQRDPRMGWWREAYLGLFKSPSATGDDP